MVLYVYGFLGKNTYDLCVNKWNNIEISPCFVFNKRIPSCMNSGGGP